MTALMVFAGLSFCASLMIVGAVVVNARRGAGSMETASVGSTIVTTPAASTGSSTIVPAYSH